MAVVTMMKCSVAIRAYRYAVLRCICSPIGQWDDMMNFKKRNTVRCFKRSSRTTTFTFSLTLF